MRTTIGLVRLSPPPTLRFSAGPGGCAGRETGHLADRVGRKHLIVTGMLVQAAAFVRVPALLDTPVRIGAGVEGRAVSGQGSTFRCCNSATPTWR